MIIGENLGIQFGQRVVFQGVTLTIGPDSKLGLVGLNGSGKSTLLSILAKEKEPNWGSVKWVGSYSPAVLSQKGLAPGPETLGEYFESAWEPFEPLAAKIDQLHHSMAGKDDDKLHRIQEEIDRLHHQLDEVGYDQRAARIGELRSRLGFTHADLSRPAAEFSAGWRLRGALARALMLPKGVLCLDEPTNYLDLGSIRWLVGYLKQRSGYVVISHNRWFLDQVCTSIVELRQGKAHFFTGNYSAFKEQQTTALEQAKKDYAAQQERIAKTEALIDRFKAKANKASFAKSKEKELERMEMIEEPWEAKRTIQINWPSMDRLPQVLCEVEDVGFGYENQEIFSQVNLTIERGDRIALVGSNGAGKSTLLRLLSGNLKPNTGTARWNGKAQLGHFDSEYLERQERRGNLLDIIDGLVGSGTGTNGSDLLGAFMFSGDDRYKDPAVLSGGERHRFELLCTLLGRGNCLFLDEPTNHLDLDTIPVLADALASYPGSLLFVSHDEDFVSRLATTIIAIEGDGEGGLRTVTRYPGDYEYYRSQLAKGIRVTATTKVREKPAAVEPETKASSNGDLSYQEHKDRRKLVGKLTKEFEDCEATIAELEEKIAAIHDQLGLEAVYSDPVKSAALSAELVQLEQELEGTMERWSEIGEELEQLES